MITRETRARRPGHKCSVDRDIGFGNGWDVVAGGESIHYRTACLLDRSRGVHYSVSIVTRFGVLFRDFQDPGCVFIGG
jgi:hypothetical protein